MPCPLCLLGFHEPHTKKDWATLSDPEVRERLNVILDERRQIVEEHYAALGEPVPEGLCY